MPTCLWQRAGGHVLVATCVWPRAFGHVRVATCVWPCARGHVLVARCWWPRAVGHVLVATCLCEPIICMLVRAAPSANKAIYTDLHQMFTTLTKVSFMGSEGSPPPPSPPPLTPKHNPAGRKIPIGQSRTGLGFETCFFMGLLTGNSKNMIYPDKAT